MPLKRASDRYLSDADDVRFLMQDGWVETLCRIENKTLSRFGRTVEMTGPRAIFKAYRDVFEHAASDKYDRTSRLVYEVVTITATDLGLTEE